MEAHRKLCKISLGYYNWSLFFLIVLNWSPLFQQIVASPYQPSSNYLDEDTLNYILTAETIRQQQQQQQEQSNYLWSQNFKKLGSHYGNRPGGFYDRQLDLGPSEGGQVDEQNLPQLDKVEVDDGGGQLGGKDQFEKSKGQSGQGPAVQQDELVPGQVEYSKSELQQLDHQFEQEPGEDGEFQQGQVQQGQYVEGQIEQGQFAQGQLDNDQFSQAPGQQNQFAQAPLQQSQFDQGQIGQSQFGQTQSQLGQVSEVEIGGQGQYESGPTGQQAQFGQGQLENGQVSPSPFQVGEAGQLRQSQLEQQQQQQQQQGQINTGAVQPDQYDSSQFQPGQFESGQQLQAGQFGSPQQQQQTQFVDEAPQNGYGHGQVSSGHFEEGQVGSGQLVENEGQVDLGQLQDGQLEGGPIIDPTQISEGPPGFPPNSLNLLEPGIKSTLATAISDLTIWYNEKALPTITNSLPLRYFFEIDGHLKPLGFLFLTGYSLDRMLRRLPLNPSLGHAYNKVRRKYGPYLHQLKLQQQLHHQHHRRKNRGKMPTTPAPAGPTTLRPDLSHFQVHTPLGSLNVASNAHHDHKIHELFNLFKGKDSPPPPKHDDFNFKRVGHYKKFKKAKKRH